MLCDVCVVVEGKVFKAHKNVLLGSSRYFKTLYCQVQKTSEQATVTHLASSPPPRASRPSSTSCTLPTWPSPAGTLR